jgi:hypothetical protein
VACAQADPGWADDPDLVTARSAAFAVLDRIAADLAAPNGTSTTSPGLTVTGWSLSHGLATLLLAGNPTDRVPTDPGQLTAMLMSGMTSLGRVVGQTTGPP